MFRKLTTIIDSALLRRLQAEPGLCSTQGFLECFSLTSTVIYACLKHSARINVELGEKFNKHRTTGNTKCIASLVDPYSAEGGWTRKAVKLAARIEVVISTSPYDRDAFSWELSAYKADMKKAFFTATFSYIKREGALCEPSISMCGSMEE